MPQLDKLRKFFFRRRIAGLAISACPVFLLRQAAVPDFGKHRALCLENLCLFPGDLHGKNPDNPVEDFRTKELPENFPFSVR